MKSGKLWLVSVWREAASESRPPWPAKFEIVTVSKAGIIRSGHNATVDVWRFGQGIGQPDTDILHGLYYYFGLDCISGLSATPRDSNSPPTTVWNILDKWIIRGWRRWIITFARREASVVFKCFGGRTRCFPRIETIVAIVRDFPPDFWEFLKYWNFSDFHCLSEDFPPFFSLAPFSLWKNGRDFWLENRIWNWNSIYLSFMLGRY